MDREERGRGGERHVDPGEHEAVPQVQEPHREEPGLHAHDLQVLFFFQATRCFVRSLSTEQGNEKIV